MANIDARIQLPGDRVMPVVGRAPLQDPKQHRICFGIRLQPALTIRPETIRWHSTTPHALLRAVALALVGALAGLIALPLSQHSLDAALELAILRCLLLWLAVVHDFDTQRHHLSLKLASLKIVPMAAVNRLKSHPLEFAPPCRCEQILIVNALDCTGAATGLIDILGYNALASSTCLGAQACELIRNAKAMPNLFAR